MKAETEILNGSRTVAIVGLSSNVDRPSHHVASYLKEHGYRIILVNPRETAALGEKAYPDLASVPETVDVVDIFRSPAEAPAIVREAIRIGAKAVWMQEGVISEAAAALAREAGLRVVMDKCIRKQHIRWHGGETTEKEKP